MPKSRCGGEAGGIQALPQAIRGEEGQGRHRGEAGRRYRKPSGEDRGQGRQAVGKGGCGMQALRGTEKMTTMQGGWVGVRWHPRLTRLALDLLSSGVSAPGGECGAAQAGRGGSWPHCCHDTRCARVEVFTHCMSLGTGMLAAGHIVVTTPCALVWGSVGGPWFVWNPFVCGLRLIWGHVGMMAPAECERGWLFFTLIFTPVCSRQCLVSSFLFPHRHAGGIAYSKCVEAFYRGVEQRCLALCPHFPSRTGKLAAVLRDELLPPTVLQVGRWGAMWGGTEGWRAGY